MGCQKIIFGGPWGHAPGLSFRVWLMCIVISTSFINYFVYYCFKMKLCLKSVNIFFFCHCSNYAGVFKNIINKRDLSG